MGLKIACIGDPSNHGGVLTTTEQRKDIYKVQGTPVSLNGALHACPIPTHGITPVTACISKTKKDGKLILTENAVAGCGALLTPPDRKCYVEN